MSSAFVAPARKSAAQSDRSGAERHHHEVAAEAVGVPRFLPTPLLPAPDPGSASPLPVQRQEDASLPPVPSFQLTPPTLLQPRDPYERFYPDFGRRLRLDPELELRMLSLGRALLSPPSVLAGVLPIAPVVSIPGAQGSPGGGSTSGGPLPQTPPQPAPSPTPPGPTATPRTPPSPEGGARPGSGGDVLGAVLALPQVSLLLQDVQNQFTSDFSRYWNSASTGERVGFVTSSVVVGGAILAPVLGFEDPRNFVLPLISDVVIPVPGLRGYGLEFHFGERDVMIGAHLDVGRLLPSIWGFGEASFSSIGGPPSPQSSAVPPVSRKADGDASGIDHAPVAAAIRGRAGGGAALDDGVRGQVEPRLAADLSRVRIHADAAADVLARSVHAHAFTSGRDIFFRAGRYDPESREGRRLLTHELVHVAQQSTATDAAGIGPASRGDPLRISTPGDGPEREAERLSSTLVGEGSLAAGAGFSRGSATTASQGPGPHPVP